VLISVHHYKQLTKKFAALDPEAADALAASAVRVTSPQTL